MSHSARARHSVELAMFVREYRARRSSSPLLLVHGLGESGLCFENLLEHEQLSHLRCLVPDLPGYGRSAWPPHPLSIDAEVEHLATWLRWRGEREVVAIGHSLGGVMVQLLAERHPELIRAVVDVDGNLGPEDCTFSRQTVEQGAETFHDGGFDEMRSGIARQGIADRALAGYSVSLRLADPRTYLRHSEELVEISETGCLVDRLVRLDMPRCYIAGAPDGASASSLESLGRAGLAPIIIEPSGHWPFIDQPSAFADQLLSFLELVGGSS